MKNGHLPDHWQLWLWLSVVAILVAALARQIALDAFSVSDFNANLIFVGSLVAVILLYLGFQEFFERLIIPIVSAGFTAAMKKLGIKLPSRPAPVTVNDTAGQTLAVPQQTAPPETSPTHEPENGIVKIETPTPEKIVIDYGKRREEAKRRQDDKIYQKEENVILYVGYTMSPYVEKEVVEKIISAVTEYIHASGIPEFSEKDAVMLPDTLTTQDMMHFGWNIAKPFKKYNLHTAHFLKQVFPHKFSDVEICTIERKLSYEGWKGNIKIDKDVANFTIPTEDDAVKETTAETTEKKKEATKDTPAKKSSKQARKTSNKRNNANNVNRAMAAAFADMDIQPYNLGDNVLEDDGYTYY